MNEIAPGIRHWTAVHPNIKMDVSSYYLADSATLVDPLLPDGDPEPIRGLAVDRIVLTNRHHLRSSEQIAAFERIIKDNNRPVQKLNGRTILTDAVSIAAER